MWWIPIIAVVVIALVYVIAHRMMADGGRSAAWADLHERGKIITAQLAHLRDVQAKRDSHTS